jgi:hypothetical protein
MNKLSFAGTLYGVPVHLTRINKKRARNLFNKGVKIYLCPSNLRPIGPWFNAFDVDLSAGEAFDTILNSFEYYNCINNETGYFTSFYINTLKK